MSDSAKQESEKQEVVKPLILIAVTDISLLLQGWSWGWVVFMNLSVAFIGLIFPNFMKRIERFNK